MAYYKNGDIIKVKVTAIKYYGAFIKTKDGKSGLIHISEIDNSFIIDINYYLKIGQIVEVKVLSVRNGKIDATLNFTKNGKKGFAKNIDNFKNIQLKYGFETIKNYLDIWEKNAKKEIKKTKNS
ncbi:S1 RNA-binding domain-containing protein [Gemelliphila asaccharolytica]|uniref:General stress protein 13 n=1 Tax=Gemelliphila asaccharolytica TaxID=502393 RepID=A0ABR5TNH5_9BACL|nr:S1 RNA-binding domain-containing protein [Gemella asaccharolytica]KXB58990.1 putative general stress protein 13 [Gemella asaccharolytica]